MVKIIADSTCDLSQELLEKYDIAVLPLHVLLGEAEYYDGVTVTPGEIFAWAESNKKAPKTSAPALEDAVELFRPYVEDGREIVSFCIAEGMSSSGNIMRMAARELDAEKQIWVVDSANLSTGIGLLVIEAAIMAQNGNSAVQIVEKMEELKPRVRASFVVDTLMYLYRGGRAFYLFPDLTDRGRFIQLVRKTDRRRLPWIISAVSWSELHIRMRRTAFP